MSTILEALRKLQQDGARKDADDSKAAGTPSTPMSATPDRDAPVQPATPPEVTGPRSGSGDDPAKQKESAELPDLIGKIEKMLGKEPEQPDQPKQPERDDAAAPPTAPPSEAGPARPDAHERGRVSREDWLSLLERTSGVDAEPEDSEKPVGSSILQVTKSAEREAEFTPIDDPETLDAFMELPADAIGAGSKQPDPEAAPQIPGVGGRWRDHQAEAFSGATTPDSGLPDTGDVSAAGEEPSASGLGATEARLLGGLAGAQASHPDPIDEDEPSIYVDPDPTWAAPPRRLRNIATATTALGIGLFAGFLAVKSLLGGSDVDDDSIAKLPTREERLAAAAAAKQPAPGKPGGKAQPPQATAPQAGEKSAARAGAKGKELQRSRAALRAQQAAAKKAAGKPTATKPVVDEKIPRAVVESADSKSPLRAAPVVAGPDGQPSAPLAAKTAPAPAGPTAVATRSDGKTKGKGSGKKTAAPAAVAVATPAAAATAQAPSAPPALKPFERVSGSGRIDEAAPAAAIPDAPPPLPEPEPEVSLNIPPGAPHVDLVFVQWARHSAKRLVSLRNLKGTLLVLREGDMADAAQGMKVARIGREWVDFEWNSNQFRILMNDF